MDMKNKVALLGVLTALALIFSYVESLIPIHFAIPGMKLGLANVIVVIVLYKIGFKEAFLVSIIRVIVAGFLFGNLMSVLFSLAGSSFSLVMMKLLYKRNMFSTIGISVIGAVFHNLGQIMVAMIVVESFSVMYYFAFLMISGVVTGVVIGIVANEMMKRVKVIS